MKQTEAKIRNAAKGISQATIMEVCGGHTSVIMQYGLRKMLPENVRLVSGPGCPVCVTSQHDIDCILALALNKVKIASYGDVLRVPGTRMSLDQARSKGADIKEIYSVNEILGSDYVLFAIGFETTAPMTAIALKHKTEVYCAHKLMIPPMRALLNGGLKIDGFIIPGHVSAVIGSNEWEILNVPQVISGFTPENILNSIEKLLILISRRKKIVVNNYDKVVFPDGNKKAKKIMLDYMRVVDSEWRGMGNIPLSGLDVKNPKYNAKRKYADILANVKSKESSDCRCGDVLRGIICPEDCALFRNSCTPKSPKGACMVSAEGSCNIAYRYGLIR